MTNAHRYLPGLPGFQSNFFTREMSMIDEILSRASITKYRWDPVATDFRGRQIADCQALYIPDDEDRLKFSREYLKYLQSKEG